MELGRLKDNELRELEARSAVLQVTGACLCALLAVAKISFGKDRTLRLSSTELEHLLEQVHDLPKASRPTVVIVTMSGACKVVVDCHSSVNRRLVAKADPPPQKCKYVGKAFRLICNLECLPPCPHGSERCTDHAKPKL